MKPLSLTAFIVIAILISSAVGCSRSESETAFDDGKVFFKLDRYEEAIPHFTKAIQIDSKYRLAYLFRGSSYQKLDRHQDAIADFDAGIRLDPTASVFAYNDRGISYFLLGQYEDAIDDFDKAIQLDPSEAQIYAYRGAVYSELGEYQKTIDDYTKAFQKEDGDDWFKAVYLYERGSAYKELGQDANADADFTEACSLDSKLCNGATIESRATGLASKQRPPTSSTSKSDDELEIYFEQMVTTNEEFVGVMQRLADWQDSAYPEIQRMAFSTGVTQSDFGDWFLRQKAALDEAYIELRYIPGKWAAITVPDDLAEFHNLMLQVIRLKLEVVQKWQLGVSYLLLDSNQAMLIITEGDRLDDQADDIYFQAMSEGKKQGLPFGP